MWRMGRRRGARATGQALVEFALVIPLFLLLMVALFDMGRAVFAYNTLTNAAREGARMAIVNQDKPTIVERAKSQTAIVELNDPSVSVAFYQMAADGTPDFSDPCNLVAVGCLAIVSVRGDLRADHAVDREPVRERWRDIYGPVDPERRVPLPERRLPHPRAVSEAAMSHRSTLAPRARPDHRRRRAGDGRDHRRRLAGHRGRQRVRPPARRPERRRLDRQRGRHGPRRAPRRRRPDGRRRRDRDARDGGRQRDPGLRRVLHERHRRPARSERRGHEQPQGGRGRRRRR